MQDSSCEKAQDQATKKPVKRESPIVFLVRDPNAKAFVAARVAK